MSIVWIRLDLFGMHLIQNGWKCIVNWLSTRNKTNQHEYHIISLKIFPLGCGSTIKNLHVTRAICPESAWNFWILLVLLLPKTTSEKVFLIVLVKKVACKKGNHITIMMILLLMMRSLRVLQVQVATLIKLNYSKFFFFKFKSINSTCICICTLHYANLGSWCRGNIAMPLIYVHYSDFLLTDHNNWCIIICFSHVQNSYRTTVRNNIVLSCHYWLHY